MEWRAGEALPLRAVARKGKGLRPAPGRAPARPVAKRLPGWVFRDMKAQQKDGHDETQ